MRYSIGSLYNRVKNCERYCTSIVTYNSGGNIIISEMPVFYENMDCLLVLSDDDVFSLYLNRYYNDEDSPYFDENAVYYFDSDKVLPDNIIDYAKQLMTDKVNYMKNMYGIDYVAYCKDNYHYRSLDGLFDDCKTS